MAAKKKSDPDEEPKRLERIKTLVIIAMFSDDVLMERLVLKGGNALDIVHRLSTRASVDVDLSMAGDFNSEERRTLQQRTDKALRETFGPEGYRVFDVEIEERPKEVTADLADFWGGYGIEFKLIESIRYEELKDDIGALRRNALQLGQGAKFLIDVSKHEYTAGKMQTELEGYTIFVYTPEMMVCEKLRAICQQMSEYGPVVRRNRVTARARDFVDIHTLISKRSIDLCTMENRQLLSHIFAAKRVKLSLLRNIAAYRELHGTNYPAVEATVKPGIQLRGFDFYFDYVLGVVKHLEPLRDE